VKTRKLEGLIAATYTPLNENGSVNLDAMPSMVEHLLSCGVSGIYICGSTGEGMSLSSDERKAIAKAYVEATNLRAPVIVQVGHNSLAEARQLAEHAQRIGADAISATCPSYFKVADASTLTECMAELAAGAPDLPFYYYHIPVLTGSTLDVVEFLSRAGDRIANLAGLKYTDTKLHEFQTCLELDNGRFDVLWGCDEMLLGALATGARGAIGSTYNIAAPLYHKIISEFESGNLEAARALQSQSIKMIRTLASFPFHPAMKEVLGMLGLPCGPCRLPQRRLAYDEVNLLRGQLNEIGFFESSSSAISASDEPG